MSAPKLAYRINEAAGQVGVSRSTIYRAIRRGELEMGKYRGCSVIKGDVLFAWFETQYQPVRKSAA